MTEQAKAAAAVMEEWLSHPDELGKAPAKLEIAGEFDLHGLRSFGREELEIIESSHSPSEVYDLMWSVAAYIIQEGAILRDGETLGFTKKQKLPLTLSEGVYVEKQSIKIKF